MRVRDLRWYILTSIIIIISYAAISFCYYLSIKNGMVENSMKAISQEVAEGRAALVQETVNTYYDMFINDNTDKIYKDGSSDNDKESKVYMPYVTAEKGQIFEVCEFQFSLTEKMSNFDADVAKVVLSRDQTFNAVKRNRDDSIGKPLDTRYYFYFQKPISAASAAILYQYQNPNNPDEMITDTIPSDSSKIMLTCRVPASTIFGLVDSAKLKAGEDNTEAIIETDTTVPFSNSESQANDYTLFAFEGKEEYIMYSSKTLTQGENIRPASLVDDEEFTSYFKEITVAGSKVSVLNKIYKVNNKSSVVTAFQMPDIKFYTEDGTFINDTYVATVIPTSSAILGSAWVIQQALILFFAGIIVMVAMLFLMILGVRRSSQLLRADRHSTEATKAIVIRIDKEGKVIFTNQTFKQVYGVNRLFNVDDFIDVQTKEPIINTIQQNKAFECEISDSDGNTKYLNLSPLYISRSYYLMGTEITQDYNRRKHLEIMSGKNEYTNLENGFMLANQFESIIENNAGYDIAFVEYNIFKYEEIIGVFGQTSFVALLNEFLSILKNQYGDLKIYHVTDAKFWIVYPNTDINVIIESINKTLEVFQRPITIKQNNIYVNTKVVVYNYKHSNDADVIMDDEKKVTLSDIRTKMDLAYRNIKNLTGRDYVVYDPKMDAVILAAEEMEKDIETGLFNHEFEMYLQPQFDIVNNKIAGFEALIRWHNPKYKDKSPQIFIELAEQRGHMLDIGRFVITESFKIAKKLEPYGIHVSVNISPVQLLQVGFVQQLIDEFQKLDLNPGSVAVEITETLLMGNFQLVTEKLKILKEKGFSIHLDDFGTGYSSMLYLKDLPVDTIKIDKEFTKHIETSKVSEAIVKTICNLGTSLQLGIICEGVETQIQSDMIKKFGCRIIQGYLIGKAMPYEEAVELIEKYANKR